MLRDLLAPNPSPMTLGGTRTYLVGSEEVAVIDPGPADASHIDAITQAIHGRVVSILLTHLHPDHADAADTLAAKLGAPVLAIGWGSLSEGDMVLTDAGELFTLHTPGHSPDHASFHWPAQNAVFCGDLMMGGADTALVAAPEGNLRDYLASLERLRSIEPRTIHPSHGPSFDDPASAIDRYIAHRASRLNQVLEALAAGPRTTDEVAEAVYGGTIPDALREVATGAAAAYLDYLGADGRLVRSDDDRWRIAARR